MRDLMADFDAAFSRTIEETTMACCKSCRAEIVWLKTAAGRSIPVDANEVARAHQRDGALFDPKNADLVSHFATCPDAGQHRRR